MSDFTQAVWRYKHGETLEPCEEKMVAAWKKGIVKSKRVNQGPKKRTMELIKRAAELHILGDEAHPTGYPDFKTLAEGMGVKYQKLRDMRYEYPKLWEEAYASLIPDAAADVGHLISVARLKAMQELAKHSARAPQIISEVMEDKTEPGSTRVSAANDVLGYIGLSEKSGNQDTQLSKAALEGMKSAIDTLGIVVTTQITGKKPEALEAEIVKESE
jgi:hypothetical protein